MNHETQVRIVPGGHTAVLLVHGILGTPHQFDFLLPAIPESWTMINLLLDGHGGPVENFSKSSMQKWEQQVSVLAAKLADEYENVFIAAHSMGTLLAIDAALAHPEHIKGLFLLSPPLKIAIKPNLFRNIFKVGLGFAEEDDPEAMAAKRAYSMPADRRVWKYLGWIPRYIELFGKICCIRKKLSLLRTPTKAFLCAKDEMVSVHTDQFLIPCPAVEITYLPDSSHFTYGPEDAEQLRKAFSAFHSALL